MPFNKKQTYCQVPNNDFDLRIPLHSDESFQHGIVFQAKVSNLCKRERNTYSKHVSTRPVGYRHSPTTGQKAFFFFWQTKLFSCSTLGILQIASG